MNKLIAFIAVLGILYTTATIAVRGQGAASQAPAAQHNVQSTTNSQPTDSALRQEESITLAEEKQSMHMVIKQKFIEGGPGFMAFILTCLILGLAIAIERIICLNLASTNTDKLLEEIEEALNTGGIEAAKEVCKNTKGPVASIFYHGLDRSYEGLDVVEKTIVAYGGIQTSLLEKGLVWIALFIALGPMLGFLGTVVGMVKAFDAIEVDGNISLLSIAKSIKVALITTIGGLIVAMILQVFYNYCVSRIDHIVNRMEDASISLIDLLVKYNINK